MWETFAQQKDKIVTNTNIRTCLLIVSIFWYFGTVLSVMIVIIVSCNDTNDTNTYIIDSRIPQFDQCVLPVMTYKSETWSLTKGLLRKLRAYAHHVC